MSLAAALLLAAILPAAEPEKPVEIPAKDWAVMADPEHKDCRATLEKYDGKLIKVTGRAVFSEGRPDGGGYFIRVPVGGGKTRSIPLQWAEGKAGERAMKQVENAGAAGVAMTVHAHAVFSGVADDGKRNYFLKSLHDVTTEAK